MTEVDMEPWRRTLAALESAARRAPRDATKRIALADYLLFVGAAEAAAQSYDAAARLDPACAKASLGLSRALLALGRNRDAARAARAAFAVDRTAPALAALGVALHGLHRFGEALAAFDEVLALAPDSPVGPLRAMTLGRLGRHDEARDAFRRLADVGASENLFSQWAAAERAAGAPERAGAVLQQGLARFPASERLHRQLSELRWSRGESAEQFARSAEAALAAAPEEVALRLACAALLERAGRGADAETMLRDGLARTPRDARLLAQLGELLALAGRLDEAEPVLEQAVQADPGGVQGRTLLAHARLRLGKLDEARALLAALSAQAPDDQLVIAYGALAARLAGDPAYRAVYDYERLIRAVDLPTPPGYASIGAFNEALESSLEALFGDARAPINQSVAGGVQSSDLIDSRDSVIRAFFAAALDAVRGYVASLPGDAAHPFLRRRGEDVAINDAWAVGLRAGGGHTNHIHPLGWISSAYYVRLPDHKADARAGWLQFGAPPQPIAGCGSDHWIEPKAGRLVLFPSYVWHGVEPVRGEGRRITIAFDAIPL